MSDWLRLHGEIKRRNPLDLFTETQRRIFQALFDLLSIPGQRLNLNGEPGVGKTFIAWGLARASGGIHVVRPQHLSHLEDAGTGIVLIDNAPRDEAEVRRLLAHADLSHITSAVLITRLPTALRMRQLTLPKPSPAEIEAVLRTLGRLSFFPKRELVEQPNLWQVLQACV